MATDVRIHGQRHCFSKCRTFTDAAPRRSPQPEAAKGARSSFRAAQRHLSSAHQSRVQVRAASFQGTDASPGMAPELRSAVDEFLTKHTVVLFMKGTKQFPQCGFSNTCVQVLNMLNVPFETVNILEDESLRSGMKEYSQWPTFPQLYINQEFVGGCDIVIETFQNGELKEMLEVAMSS